jgi:serine/threonine protein kinase
MTTSTPDMSALLPRKKDFRGKTYVLSKLLGKGTNGAVGLYYSPAAEPIVIKANFCGDPAAEEKGKNEASKSEAAVSAVGACPYLVSKCAGCSMTGDSIIRQPLSTEFIPPCSYAIYAYFKMNLADWLANTPIRSTQQVLSLFHQVAGIILCLKAKGFIYSDIKPSNFMVSGPNSKPHLTIGDLGGLDTKAMKELVVTPGRLPQGILVDMDWQKLDAVTAFLFGGLILQLLVRPSLPGDSRHPLDAYFECLQRADRDGCTGSLLTQLPASLAGGLSMKDKQIAELTALALTLLGYRHLFLPVEKAMNSFEKLTDS